MIRQIKLDSIVPTGTDGSATGSSTTRDVIAGRVLAVHVDYDAAQAATTDLTVATVHAPTMTILTLTDNKVSGWYRPRAQVHSTTGSGLTYDGTRVVAEPIPVCDQITASVAQADNTHPINVMLLIEV